MPPRFSRLELIRQVGELTPYPAVLMPLATRGWEVVFPNFAGLTAYGAVKKACLAAAGEMLTAEILSLLVQGVEPPKPSEPERLIADDDDPPGTELIMVEPDHGVLLKRLGIEKKEKATKLKSLGVLGKKS